MLEIEPTVRATESGRNGNESIAGAAPESFARWQWHSRVKLPSVIAYRFAARYFVTVLP